ncbi:U15 [Human betaherpesvirus 7]|nr:U15 [Human betaherpesvirus 7]
METWRRQRLQEFRELCPLQILMTLSNIISKVETIYIKYLFQMDFNTTYRFIFSGLTLTTTVTKSVVIEALFIIKRWQEIKQIFNLDVHKTEDCYIVAQFTHIPVKR